MWQDYDDEPQEEKMTMWTMITDAFKKALDAGLEKYKPIKQGWVEGVADWRSDHINDMARRIEEVLRIARVEMKCISDQVEKRLSALEASHVPQEGSPEWAKRYDRIEQWRNLIDGDVRKETLLVGALREEVSKLRGIIAHYGPPNMDVRSVREDLMAHIEKLEKTQAPPDILAAVAFRFADVEESLGKRMRAIEENLSDLRNALDLRFKDIESTIYDRSSAP
jgi:hypothetical protein